MGTSGSTLGNFRTDGPLGERPYLRPSRRAARHRRALRLRPAGTEACRYIETRPHANGSPVCQGGAGLFRGERVRLRRADKHVLIQRGMARNQSTR
jgi:hypothetical protein